MNVVEEWMHWNLGWIYLHLKSNTKLTTLSTLCDTGKLVCLCGVLLAPLTLKQETVNSNTTFYNFLF